MGNDCMKGSEKMSLTDRKKALIRESWAKVDHRVHGVVFYQMLFKAHPEYFRLFPSLQNRGDPDTMAKNMDDHFVHQALLTFGAINRAVSLLDDPGELTALLQALGKRHVQYGVHRPEFIAVQPVVIKALNAGLGGMDPELREAWETGLKIICDIIVSGQ